MQLHWLIIAAFAVGLAQPATAQPAPNALLDRLRSIDRASVTSADCDAQFAKAGQLNAPDLLYAASVCMAAKRPVDGTFLLHAGQARAVTDLLLMTPASKADSEISTGLYGVLYFYAGGPGDDEVLRQPALRARLFTLFDRWSPAYGMDYDPGWRLRRRPDEASYRAAMAEAKASGRKRLDTVVKLASDEVYASLEHRLQELTRRNPNGFVAGTADAKSSSELIGEMQRRAVALGVASAPSPPETSQAAAQDRFPPGAAAADEVRLSGSDRVTQRCADSAERMAIAQEAKIVAVLVTRSPKWGTIWRADLATNGLPMQRITCTAKTTSSRPLKIGVDDLSPLSK